MDMSADVVSINATKESVVADLSGGFSQIANTLLEALSITPLTGREIRIMMVVIRQTYGWSRKSGVISEACLERATGIDRKNCGKIRRELVKKSILIVENRETKINTRISDWNTEPVKQKGRANKSQKGSSTTPEAMNNTGVVHNPMVGSSTTPARGRLQPQKGVVHNPPLNIKENSKETFKENSPSENTLTSDVKKSLLEKVQLKNPQAVIATKKGQAIFWGEQTDLDLANQIWDMATIITMDTKEPSWATWANEIRLMRSNDKRTDQQILALFTFANQDSFWSANVLSPSKLREKWGTLAARYNLHRAERSTGLDTSAQGTRDRLNDTSWGDQSPEKKESQSTATATLEQLTDNDW
jgi:phage replication O-like protein O